MENNVPFSFHQTGAHFIKDGRLYNIERKFQKAQARKAGIDFRIGGNDIPETGVSFRRDRATFSCGWNPSPPMTAKIAYKFHKIP